ncbi:hypothetical protein [Balneicella halophila]|uniref:hypothetical protein n=1 Tax=Balneicella halophila TaxID=1537566 RepID=UPI000E309A5F|nr:hypothetical protein [Balneicella halophila]
MKKIVVLVLGVFVFFACGKDDKDAFVGTYKSETQDESNTNYQTLMVKAKADSIYEVTFTSTNIKEGNEGCTFKKEGNIVNDILEVPIEEWDKGAKMIIKSVDKETLEVTTKLEENIPALKYFCKDGSTLAGKYTKVKNK